MTNTYSPLLGANSLKAIAEIATSTDDAQAVFADAGIKFQHESVHSSGPSVFIPGVRNHVVKTLNALDLKDPPTVQRVLRAIQRMVELYQASEKDRRKLILLHMSLEADGFALGQTSDLSIALGNLAAAAANALSEMTGIRAEIRRLESSPPDDPAVAIGRAKNLVEATAKAVLTYRNAVVQKGDSIQALAAQAMEELNVHPKNVSTERDHVRRMLGRLQGIVQDLGSLRNEVGDGHGNATEPEGLEPRHGRLAVGSAVVWCSFMLEALSAPPSAEEP